jgi:glycosyltransferase involved in cell wall biosynthesis
VRPTGRGGLLWEERDDRAVTTWCRESDGGREAIAKMLMTIGPVHAHVHHAIGLPEALFDLLEAQGLTYDWTIHDYYTICPRINLIGADGRYCGEPDQAGCQACLASLGDASGRAVTESIVAWRQRSERRLAGARRIFAPSTDVCRRIERYFPGLSVLLRPHAEVLPSLESLAAPLRHGENVRVAVIGTLVAIKGSIRLLACARDARARQLPLEFHVIGATDRDRALSRTGHVRVTGRYRERDVYDRLKTARPHLAFLPSECPESFMFALSIAMAARLFVVCFDLGAQASRVREWRFGLPIGIELDPGEINDTLIAAAKREVQAANPPRAPEPAHYPDILMSYYDFTAAERSRIVGPDFRHAQRNRPSPHIAKERDHAHLH